MKQFRKIVRVGNIVLFKYEFIDQDRVTIDLTPYTTVRLHVKCQGIPYAEVDGEFDGAKTLGKVKCPYTCETEGIWDAQFVAFTAAGEALYGEIIQFRAAINVNDLALNQLPNY